jgi:hypothetical protein
MGNFTFADRYAEAGLAPGAAIIVSRQEPANRIAASITDERVLILVNAYYSNPGVDLTWLRDEFIQEDPSFSLVNNEREARLLSALVLGKLVQEGKAVAILGLVIGRLAAQNQATEFGWLLQDASQALAERAVSERRVHAINTKITWAATAKLTDEVAAVAEGDWPGLVAVLGKIRSESHIALKGIAAQSSEALLALERENDLLREETQMLWWLFSGHSAGLQRSFVAFTPSQAALVGALDLGSLTTSILGPIAAPAMLERVIALSKRPKGQPVTELAKVIDSFAPADLLRLSVLPAKLPPRLAPITAAIEQARTIGQGAWHVRFQSQIGLDPSMEVEPTTLAQQLYLEHLLGQLL